MLVVDTSAFISLAVGGVLETTTEEFQVATTELVVNELERTADYDDRHGDGATTVLEAMNSIDVTEGSAEQFVTSRIDEGEASCVAAVRQLDAEFLITDDYRALPELQALVQAEVALSPILLRALFKRKALNETEAKAAFEAIADGRDWLGAPIYRYAHRLFDSEFQ